MSFPTLVPEGTIERLKREEKKKLQKLAVQNGNEYHGPVKEEINLEKEQWLAIFAKCLSPAVACKQTGVSMARYRRWRQHDWRFGEGINEAMDGMRDELITSVIGRATGYVAAAPEDAPTDSGYVEDAAGTVRRFGGSDVLAKSLLLSAEEEAEQKVRISIDLGGLGLSHVAAQSEDTGKQVVIEYEADGPLSNPDDPQEPTPDAA